MDEKTVVIQEYEPEHLDALVALHQACFPAETNFSVRLGPRFLRATHQFFLDDPKSFGFVAISEDNMVGFVCGRLGLFTEALDRYRAPVAALALLRRPWLLFEAGVRKRLARAITKFTARRKAAQDAGAPPKRNGPIAALALVGVHPGYVHTPHTPLLSDQLLATAESLCKREQMQFVQASVARSNIGSRFLFRRRGYTEEPGKGEVLSCYLSLEGKE